MTGSSPVSREHTTGEAAAATGAAAYDQFVYPGYAYPATHPARLEVIGRLFGLDPAPAAGARVLELGCGDGGNLLSLAAALPGASLLGIDAAAGAIARGSELARSCGLENARLRCLNLEALPDDLGSFDYIVSHGVYSWIPPRTRAALLACIRQHMAPHGIAYVSYNAYPGSYLRDMARDILDYHVRDIADPQQRLTAAQELMQTIVAIEEPSPYAQVLRDHMERMLRYSDALLFHDDLAEVSTPFYLHEFTEHAARHGLRFLSEAELFESQMRDVPESAGRLMMSLPDDVVVREQYLDFFKNRMFRQTLLCHTEAPVTRELDDHQLERFAISSSACRREDPPALADGEAEGEAQADGETFETPEGFLVTSSEPLVQAAMRALSEAWPAAVDFSALLGAAVEAAGPDVASEAVAARLREVLLQAHLARIVQLHGCQPPVASSPAERPLASPLARAQLAAGVVALSSLTHASTRLEGELESRLLPLLDGTRTLSELAATLEESQEQVEASLVRFASVGLLHAS